jgi:hypothetical protein
VSFAVKLFSRTTKPSYVRGVSTKSDFFGNLFAKNAGDPAVLASALSVENGPITTAQPEPPLYMKAW